MRSAAIPELFPDLQLQLIPDCPPVTNKAFYPLLFIETGFLNDSTYLSNWKYYTSRLNVVYNEYGDDYR